MSSTPTTSPTSPTSPTTASDPPLHSTTTTNHQPTANHIFQVIQTYTPNHSGEISLNPGDTITNTKPLGNGWTLGRNVTQDIVGIFPSSCIRPVGRELNSFGKKIVQPHKHQPQQNALDGPHINQPHHQENRGDGPLINQHHQQVVNQSLSGEGATAIVDADLLLLSNTTITSDSGAPTTTVKNNSGKPAPFSSTSYNNNNNTGVKSGDNQTQNHHHHCQTTSVNGTRVSPYTANINKQRIQVDTDADGNVTTTVTSAPSFNSSGLNNSLINNQSPKLVRRGNNNDSRYEILRPNQQQNPRNISDSNKNKNDVDIHYNNNKTHVKGSPKLATVTSGSPKLKLGRRQYNVESSMENENNCNIERGGQQQRGGVSGVSRDNTDTAGVGSTATTACDHTNRDDIYSDRIRKASPKRVRISTLDDGENNRGNSSSGSNSNTGNGLNEGFNHSGHTPQNNVTAARGGGGVNQRILPNLITEAIEQHTPVSPEYHSIDERGGGANEDNSIYQPVTGVSSGVDTGSALLLRGSSTNTDDGDNNGHNTGSLTTPPAKKKGRFVSPNTGLSEKPKLIVKPNHLSQSMEVDEEDIAHCSNQQQVAINNNNSHHHHTRPPPSPRLQSSPRAIRAKKASPQTARRAITQPKTMTVQHSWSNSSSPVMGRVRVSEPPTSLQLHNATTSTPSKNNNKRSATLNTERKCSGYDCDVGGGSCCTDAYTDALSNTRAVVLTATPNSTTMCENYNQQQLYGDGSLVQDRSTSPIYTSQHNSNTHHPQMDQCCNYGIVERDNTTNENLSLNAASTARDYYPDYRLSGSLDRSVRFREQHGGSGKYKPILKKSKQVDPGYYSGQEHVYYREGKRKDPVLRLIFSIIAGLVFGVLVFLWMSLYLDYSLKASIPTAVSVFFVLTVTFALSRLVLCTAALLFPSLCTTRGRISFLLLITGIVISGPIKNVYHNMHEVSRSMGCSAEQAYNQSMLLLEPFDEMMRQLDVTVDNLQVSDVLYLPLLPTFFSTCIFFFFLFLQS